MNKSLVIIELILVIAVTLSIVVRVCNSTSDLSRGNSDSFFSSQVTLGNQLIRRKRGLFGNKNILKILIEKRKERIKKFMRAVTTAEMKLFLLWIKKNKEILEAYDRLINEVNKSPGSSGSNTSNGKSTPKPAIKARNPDKKEDKNKPKVSTRGENDDPVDGEVEPKLEDSTSKPEKKNTTIRYTDPELISLCENPVFDSVDTNLDNSEVLIYKNDTFYLMENLRYGSGTLVTSGKTNTILPGFEHANLEAVVTIKEGPNRGFVYAFYSSQQFMVWGSGTYQNAQHSIKYKKSNSVALPKKGFTAAIHNRNVEKPLVIGFNGKTVYYYELMENRFIKVNETAFDKSAEKFPSDLTAATELQNGFIYTFRKNKYCIREMAYEPEDPKDKEFCDKWHDTRRFLGCYGEFRPPYSISNYGITDDSDGTDKKGHKGELCDDLKFDDITKAIDGNYYVIRDDKFWTITGFPNDIVILGSDLAEEKWPGFLTKTDAFMIVEEGHLRGQAFAFRNLVYNHWTLDGLLKSESIKFDKINAVLQNSDAQNHQIIGFGENKVIHFNTTGEELTITKSVDYLKSAEHWPKGVTASIFLNLDNIYLFQRDKYCVRAWKCKDNKNFCCKWLSVKDLFKC